MDNRNDNKKLTSERLRIAREMAGLSQNQAAKLLNISRPTISEIEAGRRNVTSVELSEFSDLYNVDILWLHGRTSFNENSVEDTIKLAARELQNMNDSDVEKLKIILSSMKKERAEK